MISASKSTLMYIYFLGVFLFSLAAIVFGVSKSAVPVAPHMKTFSHAIKNGKLLNKVENVVFEHYSGPGVVTQQWFAGEDCLNEDAVMKIYVDGEESASLDFNLYMAHGIGVGERTEKYEKIWGFDRMSHTAINGGLMNTFRIPYGSSIRITLQQPKRECMFWYIVRGVEKLPVVLGDLTLPANARLRLYKNVDKILGPLEYLELAKVQGKSGALFLTTMKANSSDFQYLEGCFRAKIDAEKLQLLSSGTEDIFLSAYYFNKGTFHLSNSGLTSIFKPGFMTAYKFFENDPVLFANSFSLIARCGEDQDCREPGAREFQRGESGTCFSDSNFQSYCYPAADMATNWNQFKPSQTVVTTYTWIYEWDPIY